MASVSVSLAKGADGIRASDFTVGTLAQGAGDIELRFTSTLSKKELAVALESLKLAIVARNDVLLQP
jgi:hypothetical protein